jgi:hypothetical protein
MHSLHTFTYKKPPFTHIDPAGKRVSGSFVTQNQPVYYEAQHC